MQSSPSSSNLPSKSNSRRDSTWTQFVLVVAATGLGVILWVGQQKKKTSPLLARQAKLHPQTRRNVPIKVLPLRVISTSPSPKRRNSPPTVPGKRPVKIKYNPTAFFYPLPFPLHLKKRTIFYKKKFVESSKIKIEIHEKLFLKRIRKERIFESKFRRYRMSVVRISAVRYMRYRGHSKYQALGFQELHRFETILDRYLAEGGPVDRIPKLHTPLGSLAAKLAPFGGYYPILLKNIGLLKQSRRLTEEQRLWLRTLFLARWSRCVMGHYSLPILMGKTLYGDYTKARILFSRNPKRRLWAVRELRRSIPEAPTLRTLGWLLIQLRQPAMAARSFRDALKKNPRDTLTRTLLDKLLKSLS